MELKIISRAAAAIAPQRFFFTGKACARGHIAQRYVSTGQCRECMKESSKESAGRFKLIRHAALASKERPWLIIECPNGAIADTVKATTAALGCTLHERPPFVNPNVIAGPDWKPPADLHPGLRNPTETFVLPGNQRFGDTAVDDDDPDAPRCPDGSVVPKHLREHWGKA